MEATFTEGTITAALGISDQWGDNQHNKSIETLANSDQISDVIEDLAKETKVEELGVESETLTPYEKKLVMTGFFIGSVVAQANVKRSADLMGQDPMAMMLALMSQMDGEEPN